jgi:hypothetical protein
LVRARGSYPRRRGFKSPLRHIVTLLRRIFRLAAIAAALSTSVALAGDGDVPAGESAPLYEETTLLPEETATLPPSSPWENITELKKTVAAGELTADALVSALEEGNAFGLYDRVTEVAEIALGTPASVKATEEAERAAALRAQERLPDKRPSRSETIPLEFESGIPRYQADARIWNEAGVAYLMRVRGGDAKEAFTAAVARDPRYADPHANLGLLYRKKGWYAEALAEYDLALELDAADAIVWYNRAVTLLRMGRIEETFRALETSARLDPKYRPPIRRLAILWYDLGDYKAAQLYAQRFSLLINGDPTAGAEEKAVAANLISLCELRLSGAEAPTKTAFEEDGDVKIEKGAGKAPADTFKPGKKGNR